MKKNFKLVLALILAAMMIASMIPAAVAANGGDLNVNSTLTVTGLDEGDTVTYYKVLTWGPDESTPVDGIKNGTDYVLVGTPAAPTGWVWGPGVNTAGLTNDDLLTIIGVNDGSGVITGAMASKVASNLGSPVASNMATSNGTWTVNDVAAGLYMVIVTPHDPSTIYNPIFVAANFYGGDPDDPADSSNRWAVVPNSASYSDSAMVKKATIPLDKYSEGTDSDNNYKEGSATNTSYTADYNEPINFHVDTHAPKYGENYTHPVFKLTDNLHGLKLTGANVKVYMVDDLTATTPVETELTVGTDYTITGNEEGSESYTVTFTENFLWGKTAHENVATGTDIRIRYTAKVTDDCELIVNQEDNTVDLKFSNTPDDSKGYGLKRDQTNHFTFSIDANLLGHDNIEGSSTEAIKVGVDKEGNYIYESKYYEWSKEYHGPLAGAKFGLYTDRACTQLYTNTKFTGEVYSDATGRLTIKGLDAGTYYLKELSAPAGFIKLQDAVKVKITADIDENVSVVEEVNNEGVNVETTYVTNSLKGYSVEFFKLGATEAQDTNLHTTNYTITLSKSSGVAVQADRVNSSDQELLNTKGVELPHTGGIGTTIFYVGGSLLVLAAAILLITKRRMSSND